MNKKNLSFLASILGIAILIGCTTTTSHSQNYSDNNNSENNFSDEYEAAQVCIKNMKLGWNIGNSLDCYGSWIDGNNIYNYETAWGNPIITKELIHCVKENGFNAVRIPITWFEKMNTKGTVSKRWFSRVKEVVDYVLDEDMYCIINVHHDAGGGDEAWLLADREKYESGMSEKFVFLWQQIAEYFKDYDEKLLFESFNEILDGDKNWGGSNSKSYDVVNDLNQLFVDTIRNSGGNNLYRNIIVATYGDSSASSQVNGFSSPTDSVENHLIAEVHIYDPSGFCNGTDETWDNSDCEVVDSIFERLNEKIIKKQNLPIIVGEFGSQDKFNTDEYTTQREKYASYFVKTAKNYGITCFWWDDGGSMKIFDRKKSSAYCKTVIDAMITACEEE